MFPKVVGGIVLLSFFSAKWDSLVLSVTLAVHIGVSSWRICRTTSACIVFLLFFSFVKVALYSYLLRYLRQTVTDTQW